METMGKLWRGEHKLVATFWVYWFIPTLILNWIIASDAYRLLLVRTISISTTLSAALAFGLPVLIFLFHIVMSVVNWRASSKYDGFRLWPILTKVYILLFALALVFSVYMMSSVDREDPGMDSTIISEFLDRDPNYPYVGLWKNDCADGFGLSIDKNGEGLYSVSFCGPGGCFKPGTYRPNTKIENDPQYKIIDKDTIQVKGLDGFSTYIRCE